MSEIFGLFGNFSEDGELEETYSGPYRGGSVGEFSMSLALADNVYLGEALEDWSAEESAEPSAEEIEAFNTPVIAASALGRYDIIGHSWTKDTIGAYIQGRSLDRKVWMTVLHNSATPASSDKGLATVKSFYNYHVHNRGWKSIGYHWVIDKHGSIHGARIMDITGAHAGRKGNPGSIGVCLIGNHEKNDTPTQAQKDALSALHVALSENYYGGLKPSRMRFHREFMSTGCPGKFSVDEVNGWIKSTGGPAYDGKPDVILDGKKIGDALLVEGRTYLPVRALGEALGLEVQWNEQTKEVTLKRKD